MKTLVSQIAPDKAVWGAHADIALGTIKDLIKPPVLSIERNFRLTRRDLF